jgi:hypothetical protein
MNRVMSSVLSLAAMSDCGTALPESEHGRDPPVYQITRLSLRAFGKRNRLPRAVWARHGEHKANMLPCRHASPIPPRHDPSHGWRLAHRRCDGSNAVRGLAQGLNATRPTRASSGLGTLLAFREIHSRKGTTVANEAVSAYLWTPHSWSHGGTFQIDLLNRTL